MASLSLAMVLLCMASSHPSRPKLQQDVIVAFLQQIYINKNAGHGIAVPTSPRH